MSWLYEPLGEACPLISVTTSQSPNMICLRRLLQAM
jgi:hypothetical protein